MEKEPYNVARELLEKYDPKHPSLVQTTPQPAVQQPPRSAGTVYTCMYTHTYPHTQS